MIIFYVISVCKFIFLLLDIIVFLKGKIKRILNLSMLKWMVVIIIHYCLQYIVRVFRRFHGKG